MASASFYGSSSNSLCSHLPKLFTLLIIYPLCTVVLSKAQHIRFARDGTEFGGCQWTAIICRLWSAHYRMHIICLDHWSLTYSLYPLPSPSSSAGQVCGGEGELETVTLCGSAIETEVDPLTVTTITSSSAGNLLTVVALLRCQKLRVHATTAFVIRSQFLM